MINCMKTSDVSSFDSGQFFGFGVSPIDNITTPSCRSKMAACKILDVSMLAVGQVYKSYRQLCAVLGEDIKTGGTKTLQLKQWNRFFEWSKDGNKFIITNIYETPLPPSEDKRSSRISEITQLIQLLFIEYIHTIQYTTNEEDDRTAFYYTRNDCYEKIGLVSRFWRTRYYDTRTTIINDKYAEQLSSLYNEYKDSIDIADKGFTTAEVDEVTGYAYKMLYSLFYRSICTLERHSIIDQDLSSVYYELFIHGGTDGYLKLSSHAENKDISIISNRILIDMCRLGLIGSAERTELFKHNKYLTYYRKLKSTCFDKYNYEPISIVHKIVMPNSRTPDMALPDVSTFATSTIKENIQLLNALACRKVLEGLPKMKSNKSLNKDSLQLEYRLKKQSLLIDYYIHIPEEDLMYNYWNKFSNEYILNMLKT